MKFCCMYHIATKPVGWRGIATTCKDCGTLLILRKKGWEAA